MYRGAILGVSLAAFGGLTAQAQTIDQCTGRNANAAEAGRVGGASLVLQAWATVNDCSQLSQFEQIIRDDEALLVCEGSAYVVCRCLGMKQGMEDQLLNVEVACSAGVSSAPAPSSCTGANLQAYESGVAVGASLASQAWKGCDEKATYEQAIADALALLVPPADADQWLVCRVTGTKDGMTAKADTLVAACP
jgi:hypothetical protein